MQKFDVIIIGAGAAGLMCAIEAGRRGRRVIVIEHTPKPGEKIRISGGGRCNFTNIHAGPENYLSNNPHFCVSALSRYTPQDFIAKINAHNIDWHEKKLGQLFCDQSAQQIINMLTDECREAGIVLQLSSIVENVDSEGDRFVVTTNTDKIEGGSLVVATGGKSIPKMGATDFAYRLAEKFGVACTQTRPALVPLTFGPDLLDITKRLSGAAADIGVTCNQTRFYEALLFTHRGLSGPAILQISSYWREGQTIEIDFSPSTDLYEELLTKKSEHGRSSPLSVLSQRMPKRIAQMLLSGENIAPDQKLAELSNAALEKLSTKLSAWPVTPMGSEGYRTAEVTLGGIDTNHLNSKTMAAKTRPNLYFIGEAVDVTGWLGGYNFQWAWASGWAAGQVA